MFVKRRTTCHPVILLPRYPVIPSSQAAPPLALPYLGGYAENVQDQVRQLVAQNRLGEYLAQRYPARHAVQTDRALYDYCVELKRDYLRSAPGIDKVTYDSRLDVMRHALGLNTAISRVQGGKLKAKKEIRVAALFKEAAPEFLRMIVVHELAHLRERDHNKAFYRLCESMQPGYHQIEFDLRLYLMQRDLLEGAR
jgi:predicted metal-dependent hydrolase